MLTQFLFTAICLCLMATDNDESSNFKNFIIIVIILQFANETKSYRKSCFFAILFTIVAYNLSS